MGKIVVGLWIAALLFAGFWFGYYQEGANRDLTIEFKSQGQVTSFQAGQDPRRGTMYVTKDKVAIVSEAPSSPRVFRLLLDLEKRKFFVINDDTKTMIVMDFELVPKEECVPGEWHFFAQWLFFNGAGDPSMEGLARQPESKPIAGFRCHAFAGEGVKGFRERATLWFTYEIPLGRVHAHLVNGVLRAKISRVAALTNKPSQLSHFEYFPVPLAGDVTSSAGHFKFTVENVTPGKVDRSLFDVPTGYEQKEF